MRFSEIITKMQTTSISSDTSAPYNEAIIAARIDTAQNSKQRRASVESLTKMERIATHADKDALFSSIKETNWTVADHYRLYAIDRLQTRIMEYHNNVHRRGRFVDMNSNSIRPEDVVAFFMTCSASHSDKLFQPIEKSILPTLLRKSSSYLKSKPSSGVQWLHMMDLSVLSIIAEELHFDPMVKDHFGDLRFHSMSVPLLGGCCISICYFQMDPFTLTVGMYKLYFYVTHGFILTFVAELMPDVDAVKSSSSNSARERDALALQNLLSTDDMPVPIDAVFNAVADRWESLTTRAAELGPMLVFCELASEALIAQDTLMEFLSRSIFHFKKKTSFRMSYRKKLQLVKRLHIVGTGINMVESCTSAASQVVTGFVKIVFDRSITHFSSATFSEGSAHIHSLDALIPFSVLGVKQMPVLHDLLNSYNFVHSCLVNEAKEVRIVAEAIDSISQMRADNTALVLSLIATIFLPATFLTGVFGMNFQENGGYTISIVNSKYGPLLFYCLCVTLAICLTIYYLSMGWIEAFGFVRFGLNVLVGKRMMIRMLGGDFEEDINDDPAERTPKLVNVAGLVAPSVATTPQEQRGPCSTGNMSDLSRSRSGHDDDPGVNGGINLARSMDGAPPTIRNPLASTSSCPAAIGRLPDEAGLRHGQISKPSFMVPRRVAEAVEEEARRQEEAQRRRELAQLQGVHLVDSGMNASAMMRGSITSSFAQPTLQRRSHLASSRSPSVASASSMQYGKYS